MKLNLSKNKKFLLSLLVLAITYCSNVNATVCKWEGCVPMFKDWYHIGYHRFNRQHIIGNINHLNEYTNQNINDIKDKCDYWEGQWPLNCPMKLVDIPEDNIMWTDELLNDINNHRSKSHLPLVKCFVPRFKFSYGPFGEVIYFPDWPKKLEVDCNKAYKLYPFFPEFKLLTIERPPAAVPADLVLNTKTGKYELIDLDERFNPGKKLQLAKHFVDTMKKFLEDHTKVETPNNMLKFQNIDKFVSPTIFSKLIKYAEDMLKKLFKENDMKEDLKFVENLVELSLAMQAIKSQPRNADHKLPTFFVDVSSHSLVFWDLPFFFIPDAKKRLLDLLKSGFLQQ